MKPYVVYFHVPIIADYMKPTKTFIDRLEIQCKNSFEVIDGQTHPTKDDQFGKYLRPIWGEEDIIIIGQDNVPTLKTLVEMLECDYPHCVNPCISYPASTALDVPVLNQIDEHGNIYKADERPSMCYYGGTGVCKISKETQRRYRFPKTPVQFPMLDSTLKQIGIVNWHSHYPIHQHTKTDMELKHWT